jgi:hypothetical protein
MSGHIQLGDLWITFTRKAVKNIHLSVHPPDGRVTLVAPSGTRLEVARAYAASRLGWIRNQQEKMAGQARETPRLFVNRESHLVWGRRYLLTVEERASKPSVRLDHRRITLSVRPGSDAAKRAAVLHEWHKTLLHGAVQPLLDEWAGRLGVTLTGYFVRRMKTKWGSCTPRRGFIRLNTELVKKPMDLLEYVVVHELIHLIEPTHNNEFVRLLTKHYPTWREARAELNELPLTAEVWRE